MAGSLRAHARARRLRLPLLPDPAGLHNEHNQPGDVVAVTDLAYARISPKWWPGNPGAALVIPRGHHENLYDIPADVGHAVWDLTQQVAVAMRDGVRLRGHLDPPAQRARRQPGRVAPPRPRLPAPRRRPALRAAPHDAWVTAQEREPYADRLAAALDLPRTFG